MMSASTMPGSESTSNQKLYIVPHRRAFVFSFSSKVSGLDQVMPFPSTMIVQSVGSKGSPLW